MQTFSAPIAPLVLLPTVGRSTGRHMSDLYNDLYQDLEPKRFDKTKPMDVLRVTAGLALEKALEQALISELGPLLGGERPGELMTADGKVAFSPDLILFDHRGTVLGEIKVTWMSCRECPISEVAAKATGLTANWDGEEDFGWPAKFNKYFTQMMDYCYHIGTRHARLIIYFVNGDYRPPAPVLLGWDFVFTDREMEEEWQKTLNHARHKGLL